MDVLCRLDLTLPGSPEYWSPAPSPPSWGRPPPLGRSRWQGWRISPGTWSVGQNIPCHRKLLCGNNTVSNELKCDEKKLVLTLIKSTLTDNGSWDSPKESLLCKTWYGRKSKKSTILLRWLLWWLLWWGCCLLSEGFVKWLQVDNIVISGTDYVILQRVSAAHSFFKEVQKKIPYLICSLLERISKKVWQRAVKCLSREVPRKRKLWPKWLPFSYIFVKLIGFHGTDSVLGKGERKVDNVVSECSRNDKYRSKTLSEQREHGTSIRSQISILWCICLTHVELSSVVWERHTEISLLACSIDTRYSVLFVSIFSPSSAASPAWHPCCPGGSGDSHTIFSEDCLRQSVSQLSW